MQTKAKLDMFKPSAVEGCDKTFLTKKLLDCSSLLNTKQSDFFHLSPSALLHAVTAPSKNRILSLQFAFKRQTAT
jgi:hypothetical protein